MVSTHSAAWRPCLVWMLVVSTALSGCALRREARVTGVYAPAAEVNLGVYPAGTPVRLRLTNGERVEGVLVSSEADTVSVEQKAGEPPRVIAHASIAEVSVGEVSKPGRLERLPAGGILVVVALGAAAAWAVVWTAYWLLGKACESSDGSC